MSAAENMQKKKCSLMPGDKLSAKNTFWVHFSAKQKKLREFSKCKNTCCLQNKTKLSRHRKTYIGIENIHLGMRNI